MDFKDMMNQIGIDVYTVDETGVNKYKPEENPLHKHRYHFDYKSEKYVCLECGQNSEVHDA